MKKVWRVGATLAVVMALLAIALPTGMPVEAAISGISASSDCTTATISATVSKESVDPNEEVKAYVNLGPPPTDTPYSAEPFYTVTAGSNVYDWTITLNAPVADGTVLTVHVYQYWDLPSFDSKHELTQITCSVPDPSDPTDPTVPVSTSSEPSSPPPPGPDMVEIPVWSVMGKFLADTELNFEPYAGAGTSIIMAAGKTLWVVGMDESGGYFQVILSGQYLWAPVGSMGPVDEAPWNSRPLPGEVVDFTK